MDSRASLAAESILMFLALAASIPIPTSVDGEHYFSAGILAVSSGLFLAARAIRHGVFSRSTGGNGERLAYTFAEIAVFGGYVLVMNEAAKLGV
jgi:hypothetical protein